MPLLRVFASGAVGEDNKEEACLRGCHEDSSGGWERIPEAIITNSLSLQNRRTGQDRLLKLLSNQAERLTR